MADALPTPKPLATHWLHPDYLLLWSRYLCRYPPIHIIIIYIFKRARRFRADTVQLGYIIISDILYYNNMRLAKRRVSPMVVSRVRTVDGWGDRPIRRVDYSLRIPPRDFSASSDQSRTRSFCHAAVARAFTAIAARHEYTRACPLGSCSNSTYILYYLYFYCTIIIIW